MGSSRRRQLAVAATSVVVAGLVVVPAAASADREPVPSAHTTATATAASADVGDAFTAAAAGEQPHDHSTHEHPPVSTESSLAAAAQDAVDDGAGTDQAVTLPSGFADVEVITGISEATTVAFATDGTAFVALKTGQVKSFDYDSTTGGFEGNATSTDFADLRTPVNNYWDRGLTGITVDPQLGAGTGRDYVYVSYTYNRDPRDATPVVPRWGNPAEAYDQCPSPASTSPARAGCPVMMKVSRVAAQRSSLGWTMVPGSEFELLAGGCFQFGSHASGDVVFGPDGKLYASAGEGASFDTLDHGQYANPCNDPSDEGGSLRSQDYRTASDALGIDGSIVRIDPYAGLTPSQGTAASWLVAYGQRNPWRLTFRPGTDQLWSGDVGGSAWEEVNRLDGATTSSTPVNRGWPCFEGAWSGVQRHPGWDALDKPMCEGLYAAVAADPATVAAPYFSYQTRGPVLTPGEDCNHDTSSVSGVAFAPSTSSYPGPYQDSLYFADYARACVWRLGKLPNGEPDPATVIPFVQMAETPVQLKAGPGGDLYYVDYGLTPQGGVDPGKAGVHRIVYTGANAVPAARIAADQTSGPAPLSVTFRATTSTDPDGDTLTYAWDLDADGAYDDSTSPTLSRTFATGTHTVGLRVDDGHGHLATATQQVQAGNTAPTLTSTAPASSLTWSVGEIVAFAASATDAQDGALPASSLSWQLAIRHCPGGVCHTHSLQTFAGVSSGSFETPDHEHPSHLLLTVTATDGGGLTATQEIRLDPQTVALTFGASVAGAEVSVNSATHPTPYTETFIQGSRLTVTAAGTAASGGQLHAFAGWSDGGARSHELSAPTAATTYTATYARPSVTVTPSVTTGPAPLTATFRAVVGGAVGPVAYAWDLDADGAYDDGQGAGRQRTFRPVGSHVVSVLVTDARGATASATTTVQALNTAPTIESLSVAPAGPWSDRAPLTFSTTASDAQQHLGRSAYHLALERQDCHSDCARHVVRTWTGATSATFLPPAGMPYPSALFLTATLTDAQGLTDTRTVRLDPRPASLAVSTSVPGLRVNVAGTARTDGWSGLFVHGRSVSLSAAATQVRQGLTYDFVRWSDDGPRSRTVLLGRDLVELEAVYAKRPNGVPPPG